MSPHPRLKQTLESRATLSRGEAGTILRQILSGEWAAPDIAALLLHLNSRGETAEEIAGFVDAMRSAAMHIPLTPNEQFCLVDTCGTGADSSGTFNISTAAALVAAAAGVFPGPEIMVAKHGNRAVTSQSGSADVLEALGIPIALSPADGAASLRRHRFAFLHAQSMHPAMKIVMPIRRALGIRTIFHLVGPLSNPAGARAQVMGVYAAHLIPTVAEAMRLLGVRHAFVVHGAVGAPAPHTATGGAPGQGVSRSQGMDELSISGPTELAEVHGDAITFDRITPEQVGLQSAPIESLRGADAATNAAILRAIFAGEPGPRRDVVLLNAAAVLIAAGLIPASTAFRIEAFRAGIALAAKTIDSGAVTALVADLAHVEL